MVRNIVSYGFLKAFSWESERTASALVKKGGHLADWLWLGGRQDGSGYVIKLGDKSVTYTDPRLL